MNTNKSTNGTDPKGKLSFRKIAVITGVIFIIATVTVPPGCGTHTCSDWYGLPHPGSPHIRTRWPQECFSCSSPLLRKCRHSHRDVSGLEGVECGSGPWICRLQDPGGGLLHGRPREPAVPADTRPAVHNSGSCRSYVASGYRRFVGERTRPRRAGGGVRLLPGCIYVLLPVLPITAHSPMAVGLRYRRDHPDDGGLRVGLVQR